MFIDVIEETTKTPKLEHAVKWLYQVLSDKHHTVIIQQKKLAGRLLVHRFAFAPELYGVCHQYYQSQSQQTMFWAKNWKKKTRFPWNLESFPHQWQSTGVSSKQGFHLRDYMKAPKYRVRRRNFQVVCSYANGKAGQIRTKWNEFQNNTSKWRQQLSSNQ